MKPAHDVKVVAKMYTLEGKEVWSKSISKHLPTDSTMNCFEAKAPNAEVSVMLRLEAISEFNGELLSTNTYFLWGSKSHSELWCMKHADLQLSYSKDNSNDIVVTNVSDTPALMVRLNLIGSDGEQILPVEYSDNYFHLLPGERKVVNINWNPRDTRGTSPILMTSGFNVDNVIHTSYK